MEKHVQVLGILYIVFGVMGLIGALTVFVIELTPPTSSIASR